jgi:hypothetical protein
MGLDKLPEDTLAGMSYYTHHKQLGIHHQQIAHTLIGGSIE